MIRRSLILGLLAWPEVTEAARERHGCGAGGESRQPTTYEDLDGFVVQFNTYIHTLQGGVVDAKQWDRVKRAWSRMTGG